MSGLVKYSTLFLSSCCVGNATYSRCTSARGLTVLVDGWLPLCRRCLRSLSRFGSFRVSRAVQTIAQFRLPVRGGRRKRPLTCLPSAAARSESGRCCFFVVVVFWFFFKLPNLTFSLNLLFSINFIWRKKNNYLRFTVVTEQQPAGVKKSCCFFRWDLLLSRVV